MFEVETFIVHEEICSTKNSLGEQLLVLICATLSLNMANESNGCLDNGSHNHWMQRLFPFESVAGRSALAMPCRGHLGTTQVCLGCMQAY